MISSETEYSFVMVWPIEAESLPGQGRVNAFMGLGAVFMIGLMIAAARAGGFGRASPEWSTRTRRRRRGS